MFGMLVAAGVVFTMVALLVLGILGAILGLVFSLILLPFKLLGFAFRGLGFLFVLPILFVVGLVVAVALGVGAIALFTPLVPLLLIGLGLWWLLRRRRPATT